MTPLTLRVHTTEGLGVPVAEQERVTLLPGTAFMVEGRFFSNLGLSVRGRVGE